MAVTTTRPECEAFLADGHVWPVGLPFPAAHTGHAPERGTGRDAGATQRVTRCSIVARRARPLRMLHRIDQGRSEFPDGAGVGTAVALLSTRKPLMSQDFPHQLPIIKQSVNRGGSMRIKVSQ